MFLVISVLLVISSFNSIPFLFGPHRLVTCCNFTPEIISVKQIRNKLELVSKVLIDKGFFKFILLERKVFVAFYRFVVWNERWIFYLSKSVILKCYNIMCLINKKSTSHRGLVICGGIGFKIKTNSMLTLCERWIKNCREFLKLAIFIYYFFKKANF